MIPSFDQDGNLPPGAHITDWKELRERFASNGLRSDQLEGLMRAAQELRNAGCKRLWVDGSFVTEKEMPNDFDAVWDPHDVDPVSLDPTLLDFRQGRHAQKAKYGGELFPEGIEKGSGLPWSQFFQTDKNSGNPKGIIEIDLEDWRE